MTFDPFADVPADAPATPEVPTVTAPAVAAAVPQADGKVVVTLKGGTGYDSPWIVIHAASSEDALKQLQDPYLANVIERTAMVAAHFVGKVKPAAPAAQPQAAPPAQNTVPPQQQAPGGEQRFCAHGEMQYKTGVSKAGKTYKGYFCSSQDRNNQCPPQWAK